MINGYDWCSYCACHVKQPVRIKRRKKKGIVGWYDSSTEMWHWENRRKYK